MNIKEYINKIKSKINILNKYAKNPFVDESLSYNPFKSAFTHTYVWVEDNKCTTGENNDCNIC